MDPKGATKLAGHSALTFWSRKIGFTLNLLFGIIIAS
jgi:hypothetical protein